MTAAMPMSPNRKPPICKPVVAMFFNILFTPFLWIWAEVDSKTLSGEVRLNREGLKGFNLGVNALHVHVLLCEHFWLTLHVKSNLDTQLHVISRKRFLQHAHLKTGRMCESGYFIEIYIWSFLFFLSGLVLMCRLTQWVNNSVKPPLPCLQFQSLLTPYCKHSFPLTSDVFRCSASKKICFVLEKMWLSL